MFAPMLDLAQALARVIGARRRGQRDDAAERWLERACGCSRRLAAYGTLQPGGTNSQELAACPGTWSRGTVAGRLTMRDYPAFTFDPAAGPVGVQVLDSAALPAHWSALDAFEGDAYRRILVPVVLATGATTVANLYEAVRTVP